MAMCLPLTAGCIHATDAAGVEMGKQSKPYLFQLMGRTSMDNRSKELRLTEAAMEEIGCDVANEALHHIDTMYPKMWEGVSQSARISIRNTIISKVKVELMREVDDE